MKTPCILLTAFLGALPLTAETLFRETFQTLPEPSQWKITGEVTAEGKLLLKTAGDETKFVNAMIFTKPPLAALNFANAEVEIRLSDITIGGTAPAPKQAFVVVLGSDKTSEAEALSFVRLCFDGDGKVIFSAGRPDEAAANQTLAERSVAFPIREVTLQLNRQGYHLEIEDANGQIAASGDWPGGFDWTAWEGAEPYLTIKAVRRPAEGNVEASLGKLIVSSKP